MPRKTTTTPQRPPGQRTRRKKRGDADRFLAPVIHQGGQVGWRFVPSPTLRARGARPCMLRADDGGWLSHGQARAARDRLVAAHAGDAPQAAAGGAQAGAAGARPVLPARSLRALTEAHASALAGPGDEGRKADTRRFYASYMKPWLQEAGEDPVTDLDRPAVLAILDIWSREGVGRAVRSARLRALQAVLAYGERLGWIQSSPARRLRQKRPEPRRRCATPAEVEALIRAADRLAEETGDAGWSSIGTAIVAAVWTGQRQADILSCDLTTQLVPATGPFAWRLLFRTAKTDARVGPPLLPPLELRLGGRRTGPLVDCTWCKDTFRHRFADVRAKAMVKDLTFRDLRDTAVTRMYEAGATALQIASWTGHTLKTVHQILEHYIDHTQEAADEVGTRLLAWAERRAVKV